MIKGNTQADGPAVNFDTNPYGDADPHGKDAAEAGAKLDAFKVRAGLALSGFPHALEEVARVGSYGAKKYTPYGFLSVPDGEARYHDAMMRHYLDLCKGQTYDNESGCLLLAQVAWNALAWLELHLRNQPVPDELKPVYPERRYHDERY